MITHTTRTFTPAEERLMRYKFRSAPDLLQAALDKGEVISFRCRPARFIEMNYDSAVVSAWIFVGANGIGLLTEGQEINDEPEFPCRDFELIYESSSRHLLTVKRHHKNPARDWQDWHEGRNPPIQIELFENDLMWDLAAKWTPNRVQQGSQFPTLFKVDPTFPVEDILRAFCAQGANQPWEEIARETPALTKAMVLAAGRGERMRPLTDTLPKPLIAVRGKPLMQWTMEALGRNGFTQLVINTAWLGSEIEGHFGLHWDVAPTSDSKDFEHLLRLYYSNEGTDFGGALETAGGIVRALPLLGAVFWVAAGDVFAPEFKFTQDAVTRFVASGKLAHLWLVPNPVHNLKGDFGLSDEGLALNQGSEAAGPRYTFSTIGLYRAALFAPPYCDIQAGNPTGIKAPLAPILRAAMDNGRVSAELYTGPWTDVGTPGRLQQLNDDAPTTPTK